MCPSGGGPSLPIDVVLDPLLIMSRATRLWPPSSTTMSAYFREGSTYCSCMGFTVVRYWETTDWSVRPRSSTSRRARRRIRSSASVSTKILMSNISRRVGFWKIRMPSTMMTFFGTM